MERSSRILFVLNICLATEEDRMCGLLLHYLPDVGSCKGLKAEVREKQRDKVTEIRSYAHIEVDNLKRGSE